MSPKGRSDATQKKPGKGGGRRKPERKPDKPSKPKKGQVFKKIELRIREIICVKTTKELDKDEIILSSVETQGKLSGKQDKFKVKAKARAGKTIDAGKFRKGDKESYLPPKLIAQFPLGERGDKWPRNYFAVLVMVEKDEGAIGTCLERVINAVDDELVEAVTEKVAEEAGRAITATATAIGIGAAAGVIVPLVGPLIGAAAGKAVSKALEEIKKAKADDVFPRHRILYSLEEYPIEEGEIHRATANFKGFKGHYRVVYSWVIAK